MSFNHVYLGKNIVHLLGLVDAKLLEDFDKDNKVFLNNKERDNYLGFVFAGLEDWSINAPQFKD